MKSKVAVTPADRLRHFVRVYAPTVTRRSLLLDVAILEEQSHGFARAVDDVRHWPYPIPDDGVRFPQ